MSNEQILPEESFAFISYASVDRDRVLSIAHKLEGAGVLVWMDRSGIQGGQQWSEEIARALRTCAIVIVMSSAAAMQSRNVRQELQLAWKSHKPYLPLRLEMVSIPEQIEYFLEGWQWVDVLDLPEDEWLPKVLNALARADVGVKDTSSTSDEGAAQSSPRAPADRSHVQHAPPTPTNIPFPVTSFIGREQELAELTDLLSTTRLLTLTGTGGCGKTRLACRLATSVLEFYPDGVWLVDLAPLSAPDLLPQTVGAILGLHEEANRPMVDTLGDYLRTKHMLLLLDNCEHMAPACAELVVSLLGVAPGLRIVTTSRTVLGVPGEVTWRVPSLAKPSPPPPPLPIERLTQYEAVRLFIDRALAALPTFFATNETAPAIASICYHLDGIPLAIELAAPWLRVLSVEQVADQIGDRFHLLIADDPTAPPRHQTLRAAIDWSYDLLSDQEKALLRRLSVFRGGFTLEATRNVCSGGNIDGADVPLLLLRLVNKSLIQRDDWSGEARFKTLETIREYGLGQLASSGEDLAIRTAHAEYFLEVARPAGAELGHQDDRRLWDRVEVERDNVRAALEWLMSAERFGPALELASAVARFWLARGYLREGRSYLERLVALTTTAPATRSRVDALFGLACITNQQGDLESTYKYGRDGLRQAESIKYQIGVANACSTLGHWARAKCDYRAAKSYYERSLKASKRAGYAYGVVSAIPDLGRVARLSGALGESRARFEEGLALNRQQGDRNGTARLDFEMGCTTYEQARYSEAYDRLESSVALYQELGDRLGAAYALTILGFATLALGRFQEAGGYLSDGLQIRREAGDSSGSIADILDALTRVAIAEGNSTDGWTRVRESMEIRQALGRQISNALELVALLEAANKEYERALRLLGAAAALRESAPADMPDGFASPAFHLDRGAVDSLLSRAKRSLGKRAAADAVSAGRSMTRDEVILLALGARVTS